MLTPRDRAVLTAIEKYGVMDIPLITALFYEGFANKETAVRKCQDRMLRLFKDDKVGRWIGEEGYVYGKRSGHWEHRLMLNWLRAKIETQTKGIETVHAFKYEDNYKKPQSRNTLLQADGFMAMKNKSGNFRFLFLEADRSSNEFDKIPKCNQLFDYINEGKISRWWIELTKRFPHIYIVTSNESRKSNIISLSEDKKENKNGLKFRVFTLEEVRRWVE